MKKEVLIAIIAGISLGLVISFGIATAQRSLNQDQDGPTVPTPAPSPVETTDPLFINSPQPNAVVTDNPYLFTGSTAPGNMIAIRTGEQYVTGVADAQGNFALSLELQLGANLVTVTAYPAAGPPQETSFLVAYRDQTTPPTPSPTLP